MKLTSLAASRYRSLKDVSIPLGNLSVFIGPNASGKSNILDALKFLHEGILSKDFTVGAGSRGGLCELAWSGERACSVRLATNYQSERGTFAWEVTLELVGNDGFKVLETVRFGPAQASAAPRTVLEARHGKGWWTSSNEKRVQLSIDPTACALSAASVDESFPAREVSHFIRGWGFFDPSPALLRLSASPSDSERLHPHGENLSGRLQSIQKDHPSHFNRIISATRDILGVPIALEFQESEGPRRYDAGPSFHFLQKESGLGRPVHQVAVSSGTLRVLAFMTALFDPAGTGLVAVEEPENHIHPGALDALADYLKEASQRVQVLLTTHSPHLLDRLDTPESLYLIRRVKGATEVSREKDSQAVRNALVQSGFSLGEFYEARGFGG